MRSNFELASEDWATLRRLLREALDQPSARRSTWVEALPSELVDLKPRLHALLAHADNDTAALFLQTLPKIETDVFAAKPEAAAEPAHAAGQRVGPYQLLRLLGSGGMGSVWLAERTDMLQGRSIALKLPNPTGRSARLAERMAREREILATLAHPHIARLYDAGITDDSQPYLALEFVEGEALDRYAARHALTVAGRLRLYLQVLHAVAHAHARLVVHRDLKPSNILVDADGQAKLLDFGIAKLLQDEGGNAQTQLTQIAGRALTPDYASPEQIAGRAIGTASDIYSLGVVLFELLTGRRPYRLERSSPAALEEAILEAEPPRPSAVAEDGATGRALRGDIDTVVLKALKKAPEQRYATVDALAADIERHLANKPVLAQPDRAWYRATKWFARNRLAVGAAAAVLAAVVGGAALAVRQAQIAVAERERAQEVRSFIETIFRDADPYHQSKEPMSVVALLQRAQDRVAREFAARPQLRVEMLTLIGTSLNNLQEVKAAEAVLRQAVTEGTAALGAVHPSVLEARAAHLLAMRYTADADAVIAAADALLPVLRAREATHPLALASVLETRAFAGKNNNTGAEAEMFAREMYDVASRRLGPSHAMTLDASWAIVDALQLQRKTAEALALAEKTYPLTLAQFGGDMRVPRVFEAAHVYGRVLVRAGQSERGIGLLTHALDGAVATFGPTSVAAGFFAGNLARAQMGIGALADALRSTEAALLALHVQPGPDSSPHAWAADMRGSVLLAMRRPAEAAAVLRQAAAAFERINGPADAKALDAQIDTLQARARAGEARAALVELDALARRHASARGLDANHVLLVRGVLQRLTGEAPSAARTHEQLLAALGDDPKRLAQRHEALAELGMDLVAARQFARGAEILEQAQAVHAQTGRRTTPLVAEAWTALGEAKLALDERSQAEEALARADAFWREFAPDSVLAKEAELGLARAEASGARQ